MGARVGVLPLANIGGWIGRAIANGEAKGFVTLAAVIVAFVVLYKLLSWYRLS